MSLYIICCLFRSNIEHLIDPPNYTHDHTAKQTPTFIEYEIIVLKGYEIIAWRAYEITV